MKKLLTITAAVLIVGTALIAPSVAPCATEDQETACYWDASARSNGQGSSFIVTFAGTVVYL